MNHDNCSILLCRRGSTVVDYVVKASSIQDTEIIAAEKGIFNKLAENYSMILDSKKVLVARLQRWSCGDADVSVSIWRSDTITVWATWSVFWRKCDCDMWPTAKGPRFWSQHESWVEPKWCTRTWRWATSFFNRGQSSNVNNINFFCYGQRYENPHVQQLDRRWTVHRVQSRSLTFHCNFSVRHTLVTNVHSSKASIETLHRTD